MTARYAVVVPTVGRPSLQRLLEALSHQPDPLPEEIVVIDDRPADLPADRPDEPPAAEAEPLLAGGDRVGPVPLRVVRSWGRGPAAARAPDPRRRGRRGRGLACYLGGLRRHVRGAGACSVW